MMRDRMPATRKFLQFAVILAVMAGICSGQAVAAYKITKIDVAHQPDRVEIDVYASGPFRMVPVLPAEGNYLGFRFPLGMTMPYKYYDINSGGMLKVYHQNYPGSTTQSKVVVDTSMALMYSSEWDKDRKHVEITVWKHGQDPASVARKQAKAEDKQETVAVKAPAKKKDPLANAATALPAPKKKVVDALVVANNVGKTVKKETACTTVVEKSDKKGLSKTTAKAAKPVAVKPADVPVTKVAGATQELLASSHGNADTNTNVIEEPKKTYQDSALSRRVSLDFHAADINDVLKALAVQSNTNIVAGKDVQGEVTVSLRNVTLKEALDYVTKLSGFTYTYRNGVYLVGTAESLRMMTGEMVGGDEMQIVTLDFVKPDDMIGLVSERFRDVSVTKASLAYADPIFADGAIAEEKSNMLILSGPKTSLKEAKKFISGLEDSLSSTNDNLTTEVYDVKYVNTRALAKNIRQAIPGIRISFAAPDGFDMKLPTEGVTAGAEEIGAAIEEDQEAAPAEEESLAYRKLLISGSKGQVSKALALANNLDVRSPQIKIEAKICSIAESGAVKLGFLWEWDDITFLEIDNRRWGRQQFNFNTTLEALEEDGLTDLLAAPTIICLEGKNGVFFAGQEIKYVASKSVTSTGENIEVKDLFVGVILSVIGSVSTDDTITLRLRPEVSVLNRFEETSGAKLPIVDRRFTDHTIRVKDGQTIVIGGLIKNDDIETMSKVPILGDIPIIGEVFKHKNNTREKTEVVIFIKASIIDEEPDLSKTEASEGVYDK